MRFIFTHSHAFPGGTVVLENAAASPSVAAVEFVDGVALEADCRREGEDFILEIPAYRTGKGTAVGAKRWRIARKAGDGWQSVRES